MRTKIHSSQTSFIFEQPLAPSHPQGCGSSRKPKYTQRLGAPMPYRLYHIPEGFHSLEDNAPSGITFYGIDPVIDPANSVISIHLRHSLLLQCRLFSTPRTLPLPLNLPFMLT